MGISVNKEILLVGRVIVGAGIGLASMSVPMYISEASPPHFRGILVSCNVLIITFGQFIASCVCGAFSNVKPDGWKYMLGLGMICNIKSNTTNIILFKFYFSRYTFSYSIFWFYVYA